MGKGSKGQFINVTYSAGLNLFELVTAENKLKKQSSNHLNVEFYMCSTPLFLLGEGYYTGLSC